MRFIVDASKSNIGASRAHTILRSMIGSYKDIGAIVVDFKNFSRDIKQHIGKHDADMIVQKFKDIQDSSDPHFRFEYRTDSHNHLTQLFWADGDGRKNYEVFGDAVSFDATYRTNRYGMVFIPLLGIDNHWKSVTFGAILLEKEDNDNYIWACESYKKVFVKNPKCIITDQDLAMKFALQTCFPLVKHRLCMWHIMKKFPSKLGTVFCAESGFMEKLNQFIWSDHITPEEFEQGWSDAFEEFDLSDNVWLSKMFELRKFWIPAYFNDEPMEGLLRTTSRSENSNF
nr:PREDICTED: protein FAR1-RELATED SEQUENCE 5-like [Daucus carota subsp. sativus]